MATEKITEQQILDSISEDASVLVIQANESGKEALYETTLKTFVNALKENGLLDWLYGPVYNTRKYNDIIIEYIVNYNVAATNDSFPEGTSLVKFSGFPKTVLGKETTEAQALSNEIDHVCNGVFQNMERTTFGSASVRYSLPGYGNAVIIVDESDTEIEFTETDTGFSGTTVFPESGIYVLVWFADGQKGILADDAEMSITFKGELKKLDNSYLYVTDHLKEDSNELITSGGVHRAIKNVSGNVKVPTKLSELEDDENHRTITDAEKDAWNAKSEKGDAGLSAYEIAVENGFDGTETEWLESLKGAQGIPGIPGENGSINSDEIEQFLDWNKIKNRPFYEERLYDDIHYVYDETSEEIVTSSTFVYDDENSTSTIKFIKVADLKTDAVTTLKSIYGVILSSEVGFLPHSILEHEDGCAILITKVEDSGEIAGEMIVAVHGECSDENPIEFEITLGETTASFTFNQKGLYAYHITTFFKNGIDPDSEDYVSDILFSPALKKLDKKFMPDGYNNWNHIEDRPFGEEKICDDIHYVYTPNSDIVATDYLMDNDSEKIRLVKISDLEHDGKTILQNIRKVYMSSLDGSRYDEYTAFSLASFQEYGVNFLSDPDTEMVYLVTVESDNCTIEYSGLTVTFPKRGIYGFAMDYFGENEGGSDFVSTVEFNSTIKKLDEKFMPDSYATLKEEIEMLKTELNNIKNSL